MPTSNTPTPAATTLDDDVVFIRSLTKKAIGAGHKVVALMHSYGGVVGSYALTGLDGVVGLVYMTSFIPFEGESLAGIFGGTLPPFLSCNAETGCVGIEDPGRMFYDDLSEEERERYAGLLVPHSVKAEHESVTDDGVLRETGGRMAWREEGRKVGYLVCTEDKALVEWVQRMMLERVNQEWGKEGKGRKMWIWEVESGHSPMLRCPERVVECVQEFVEEL